MSNCTMGFDVMMYCPDANCAYHKAVAEVETEKLAKHKFDTSEYVKVKQSNPRIIELEAENAALSERLREAEGVIARLAECHFPSKACKGEDLPQVMLEENISIAKAYLSKTPKENCICGEINARNCPVHQ